MTTVTGPSAPAGRWSRAWGALTAAGAAISGLAPHVLHHIGLLAGVAVVTGATGIILFGVIGLVASVPFLLRLRQRFGTWRAPAIALVVLTAMFSLSAFVIGPWISGMSSEPVNQQPTFDHSAHHGP